MVVEPNRGIMACQRPTAKSYAQLMQQADQSDHGNWLHITCELMDVAAQLLDLCVFHLVEG